MTMLQEEGRPIPVRGEYDVIVCGGGLGGMAATVEVDAIRTELERQGVVLCDDT
jgi:hypothetical protein